MTHCEALVHANWSSFQCEKTAKHERTVNVSEKDESGKGLIVQRQVHVCGTHARVLDQGKSLQIDMKGFKYGISVQGILTDEKAVEKRLKSLDEKIEFLRTQRRSIDNYRQGDLLDAIRSLIPYLESDHLFSDENDVTATKSFNMLKEIGRIADERDAEFLRLINEAHAIRFPKEEDDAS